MRRRAPATIGVIAGEDRRPTRQFLVELATSLQPDDNVVVLRDKASTLRREAWRKVGKTGRLAALRDDELIPRCHGHVVCVEEGVEASPGWVDNLVRALSDTTIGAISPRTNSANGDELYVGVGYRGDDRTGRSVFLRTIGSPTTSPTMVSSLSGPCLAIRRGDLERHGGIDALIGDEFAISSISSALSDEGLRLAVAENAYLHVKRRISHGAYSARDQSPLISACLIVRDEEQNLPRCLSSLTGLADEVVVYDTGSTDSTCAVAAELGATVIEGYWDDDFARARNAALEHCRGQWILWLDADEEFVCDPKQLRRRLVETATSIEGYLVLIDNVRGTEAANTLTHPACRLFRRAYGHWQGRIHEQIFPRARQDDMALQVFDLARITHWGYLQSAVTERDKGDRNLRTAFGDLGGDDNLEAATRLLSLGRSYLFAGRLNEGIDLCRLAANNAERPSTKRLALRGCIEGLLAAKRPLEALKVTSELRASSTTPVLADIHEGHARVDLKDFAGALGAFERVEKEIDEDGFEYEPDFVAGPRAQALIGLGRSDEAADVLLGALERSGGLDAHVGVLVDAIERSGRDLAEIYHAIDDTRRRAFMPQLVQLQAEVADRVLERWVAIDSGPLVLATAAEIATRLSIERQLVWSSRLRASGAPHACPLVRTTTDMARSARERLLSAAVAWRMFADSRALLVFGALCLSHERDSSCSQEIASLSDELSAIDPVLGALFGELDGTRGKKASTSGPRTNGRRVLLVDRTVSNLRTAALAARLREAGHTVTVAHPQPASPSEELLARFGVKVFGWYESADEPESWQQQCAGLVARLYANERFDTLVVSVSARPIASRLRELIPVAQVVVDADDEVPELDGADLVLSSQASPSIPDDRIVHTPISTDAVLIAPKSPAVNARCGVCVVGNSRAIATEHFGAFTDVVAPGLERLTATTALALVGDDPAETLKAALPSAVVVGPIADPIPWIAASRVLVIASPSGAAHWLMAAAMCGTPALVVEDDATEAQKVVRAVAALVENDDLFRAFSPTSPPQSFDTRRDLFASLPEPWRKSPTPRRGDLPEVRVVGGVFSLDSLSQVNRELTSRLANDDGRFEVSVRTPEPRPYPKDGLCALGAVSVHGTDERLGDATVEIRHQWPPDFTPTTSGSLVCIQPWEFGGLPAEWIGPLRDVVDELWVPTSWVKKCAISSGVAESKVHVVPNGVDTDRFRPDGERYPLATKKTFKFLFVGGAIERKGFDALLETYLATFRADDDVCLVVKVFGSQSVYRNSTLEPALRRVAAGGGAEIEILDESLDFEEMARLYRSCDVLVHPYRGEGFGLPIAEAMASGLPVIVPNGGACLDFCDEQVGWLIDADEVPISPLEWTPSVAGSWWLEPSRSHLSSTLRLALSDDEGRATKGLAGRARIVEQFTWDAAARAASTRIRHLLFESRVDEELDEDPTQSGDANPVTSSMSPSEQTTVVGEQSDSVEASRQGPTAAIVTPKRAPWDPPDLVEHPEPGVNVVGLLEAACGVGTAARLYVDAIAETGTDYATFSYHGHDSPKFDYTHRGENVFAYDKNLLCLNPDLLPLFASHAGAELWAKGHYTIGLWFWELEQLSPAINEGFNFVNEVWAASQFMRSAFASGTDKPVVHIPMPVARRDGSPLRSRAEFGLPEEFSFLSIFDFGSLSDRKNPIGTVKSFCRAFTPGEGPVLVLKTLNAKWDPKGSEQIRNAIGDRRDIKIIDGYMSDEDIRDMIGSADCYVSLHRAEGFGLTPAEAMAWGRPVIATRYSGNLDFTDDTNSFLVPFTMSAIPPRYASIYPRNATWAEPNIDVAAQFMRQVFERREEAIARGLSGQRDIRRSHGMKTVAGLIADRLSQVDSLLDRSSRAQHNTHPRDVSSPRRQGGPDDVAAPRVGSEHVVNARQRIGLFGIPAAVIVIVIMLVVPLPTFLLDLLISVNIAAALVILMTTMHVEKARDFSVFPSLLLVATMFRLALNVSVTRLVLLHGYAGTVVESFGNFVVGGQIVVGIVIFLILIVIQFVVVTSGAGRVSEVAARFSLDAMAPKLVAIDGELNSGLIDEAEARRRRKEIDESSEFYGSMDGASKFVRGDAIAALIITMINLIGGFAIGVAQRHLSPSDAIHTYSILSIGDGLVSQIPALLLSISTGLIVTRAKTDDSDLGSDILSQINAQHHALRIAGVAMTILAFIPGLPHIPFLLIGVGLLVFAARLRRAATQRKTVESDAAVASAQVTDTPLSLAVEMRVERLELELAANLTALADSAHGGDLLDRVRALRRKIAVERGFAIPTVRTRDNVALPLNTYAIKVNGVEMARAIAPPGKLLAIGPGIELLPGESTIEPAFGLPAKWIPAEAREQAIGALGITPIDAASAIITHLSEVVATNAASLLSAQQVQILMDAAKATDPAVVDELKLAQLSLTDVHRVLTSLVGEGVAVVDFIRIVEAITVRARQPNSSSEALVEAARTALGAQITSTHARGGMLGVITIDAGIEQQLVANLHTTDTRSVLSVDPQLTEHMVSQARSLFDQGCATGREPVLITASTIRPAIANLFSVAIPRLVVMSINEIGKQVQLDRIGVIRNVSAEARL